MSITKCLVTFLRQVVPGYPEEVEPLTLGLVYDLVQEVAVNCTPYSGQLHVGAKAAAELKGVPPRLTRENIF